MEFCPLRSPPAHIELNEHSNAACLYPAAPRVPLLCITPPTLLNIAEYLKHNYNAIISL